MDSSATARKYWRWFVIELLIFLYFVELELIQLLNFKLVKFLKLDVVEFIYFKLVLDILL